MPRPGLPVLRVPSSSGRTRGFPSVPLPLRRLPLWGEEGLQKERALVGVCRRDALAFVSRSGFAPEPPRGLGRRVPRVVVVLSLVDEPGSGGGGLPVCLPFLAFGRSTGRSPVGPGAVLREGVRNTAGPAILNSLTERSVCHRFRSSAAVVHRTAFQSSVGPDDIGWASGVPTPTAPLVPPSCVHIRVCGDAQHHGLSEPERRRGSQLCGLPDNRGFRVSKSGFPVAAWLLLGMALSYGVFGRCQEFPATDTLRYEVSPGVLQHLTATLQRLSRTGLTWQDDYTQRVMARELASLPQTHPRHPEVSSPARTPTRGGEACPMGSVRELAAIPELTGGYSSRSSKQSVPDERSLSLEGGMLAEALQRYLPYLEALSQAATADALPGPELDRPPAQGEDPLADSMLTFVAQTSALTYAPAARADLAGGRPLRTLRRLQPDELSPKVAGGVDRQRLVAALGAYAARKAPAPSRDGDPAPRGLVRAPWRAPRVLAAPAAPQRWPSPADPRDAPVTDDGLAMKDVTVSTPLLGQLMLSCLVCGYHGSPGDPSLKPCVSSPLHPVCDRTVKGGVFVRGRCWWGGGRELRRGLAVVLQELCICPVSPLLPNAVPVCQGSLCPADPGPSREARVQTLLKDLRKRPAGVEGLSALDVDEVNRLGVQLGDFLQGPRSPFLPAAPRLTEPFKTESKKGDDAEASLSSEEERAGVENVRSQTYSKELLQRPLQERPGLGTAPQEDLHLGAGAQEPPGPDLRLQVQAPEEEYGYIVMENDSLSLDEGTQALEGVARLLEVPAGVFTDVEVEGPAVTFRVRANAQNVTAAAAAKAAVLPEVLYTTWKSAMGHREPGRTALVFTGPGKRRLGPDILKRQGGLSGGGSLRREPWGFTGDGGMGPAASTSDSSRLPLTSEAL
ncbi:hypothetical protein MJG53_006831 [Ovis ammon polii x Ovis aries]|uniref:Uncharacterized protein n=1 Tax=Ovis ammon polii x Ovis aries TaxID=2918886 RepID=A0ACB9V6B6_9CETA|nr:hypothetical protein MJG53_006831 [Ovis ammon polii x Ovis aries]